MASGDRSSRNEVQLDSSKIETPNCFKILKAISGFFKTDEERVTE
jgi:hypothetical protein